METEAVDKDVGDDELEDLAVGLPFAMSWARRWAMPLKIPFHVRGLPYLPPMWMILARANDLETAPCIALWFCLVPSCRAPFF